MKTYYEWSYELLDEHYDIINSDFFDKLKQFSESDENYKLCLVRNTGNAIDGLINREWAYVKNGKLPEFFDNGSKVPKKFHEELTKSK